MTTTHQALVDRHVQQHTDIASTDPTSVFVPGVNGSYITALHIVNDNNAQTTVTVAFDSTEVNAPLWESKTVSSNSELTLTFPAPFFVKSGQEIRLTAGHASRLHVWAFGTNMSR